MPFGGGAVVGSLTFNQSINQSSNTWVALAHIRRVAAQYSLEVAFALLAGVDRGEGAEELEGVLPLRRSGLGRVAVGHGVQPPHSITEAEL